MSVRRALLATTATVLLLGVGLMVGPGPQTRVEVLPAAALTLGLSQRERGPFLPSQEPGPDPSPQEGGPDAAGQIDVVNLTRQATIARLPVRPGEALRIGYVHSLYGGRVEEEIAVEADGTFRLRAISSESLAAIEYYGLPGAASAVSGGYRLRVDGRPVDRLRIQVTRLGRRTLSYGDTALPLYALVGDGDVVAVLTHDVAGVAPRPEGTRPLVRCCRRLL